MKSFFIIAIIVFLFLSSALSSENMTYNEAREHIWESYQEVDAELNRVYKIAIKNIENAESFPEHVKKDWIEQQREAQRAWIKFRDEDSKVLEYSWYHGNAVGTAIIDWKMHLTKKRIDDLKQRYSIK